MTVINLKKLGSIQQLASVRRIQYQDSRAGGMNAVQVHAGPLQFVTALDKCLDITGVTYKGINLTFLSKPGLQNRQSYDTHGQEAQRSIMGGLFFTCGTDNVGTPDEANALPMHGTLRSTPADHVCTDAWWDGDDYRIRISGEMRQAALFGENILLRRTIETVLCSNGSADTITLHDEFTNEAYSQTPFMLLYHCNIGYPLLDAGSQVHIPALSTCLRGEDHATSLPWDRIEEPVDNLPEQVFFHKVCPDAEGLVTIGVHNPSLSLGLDITYRQDQLPRLTQWKSMASGDYVVGLEPCNCHVDGQVWERENGTLEMLRPGEKKCVDLIFKVIEKCV